jgi:hypothetical protein
VRAASLLAPLVAVVGMLAACSDDDADPDEPSNEPVLDIATDTGAPVCMQVTEDLPPEVEKLPIIDCGVPHTHEIYATPELDEDAVYPGLDALDQFAQVECLAAFEPFVGTSPFDSSLSYTWLVPTLGSWNDDRDREVLCVLADRGSAELTGSMRGAGI